MENIVEAQLDLLLKNFGNPFIEKILEEVLKKIGSLNNNAWILSTRSATHLSIHFGSVIVLSVEDKDLWLALDQQEFSKGGAILNSLNCFQLDRKGIQKKGSYPTYSRRGYQSQNCYVSNQIDLYQWNVLKPFVFAYLEKIGNKKVLKLRDSTKVKHSLEANIYLQVRISEFIPVPGFATAFLELPAKDKSLATVKFDLSDDLKKITDGTQTVSVRYGQGVFRRRLETLQSSCPICGIEASEVLRASHIKPWKDSNSAERLDPSNGFLLCANHDRVFDAGLITFSDDGDLIVSKRLPDAEAGKLNFKERRVALTPEQKVYLGWHRAKVFRG